MILAHYSDPNRSKLSYLVACPKTREAALIDPVDGSLSAYEETLNRRNLRLVQILLTHENPVPVIETLRSGQENLDVHTPSRTIATDQNQDSGNPLIAVGELSIRAIPSAAQSGVQASYKVQSYTFTPDRLLIHSSEIPERPEQFCKAGDISLSAAQRIEGHRKNRSKVQNFRTTPDSGEIEQMLLEDLHTSLIEETFSPKETLVVQAYIEFLEENDYAHPSAAELGENIGNIDRSVVHVLVHSIRWKQIDRERLPLVLAGQASKWLRSLKTEPDFTPHEKEFLCTYLRLVASNGTPPSGPEIASKLAVRRSIQWVRKRAFTIRRKQREFGKPLLMLARNKSEPSTHPQGPMKIAPLKQPRERFILNQFPTA